MGLIRDLGRGPTALDTVAFIYFIEENPEFLPLLEPVFEQVDRGQRKIVTSSVTLLEVLVVPYRARNLSLVKRMTSSCGAVAASVSSISTRISFTPAPSCGLSIESRRRMRSSWPRRFQPSARSS